MMRSLSQTDCLVLWESGRALHPLDQGLLAILTAFPETRSESVADWPLGHRNRALVELRCSCFGSLIMGWTACERCGDKLQFAVDGEALLESGPAEYSSAVEVNDKIFRLPTSRDLAQIAGEDDASLAAIRLLRLCTISSSAETGAESPAVEPAQWSEEEVEAISENMAQADPLAEIRLHFDCPSCGHSFEQDLDLATFLWSEIEGRAKRLMVDVHTLSSAYGWSETEILQLSDARRNFYLEMVRA